MEETLTLTFIRTFENELRCQSHIHTHTHIPVRNVLFVVCVCTFYCNQPANVRYQCRSPVIKEEQNSFRYEQQQRWWWQQWQQQKRNSIRSLIYFKNRLLFYLSFFFFFNAVKWQTCKVKGKVFLMVVPNKIVI